MNILVTGGAGYIGSIAVISLLSEGHNVIVVDNLSKGRRELVDSRAKFYQIDLVNKDILSVVFKVNKIDAIIHFAGYKAVDESMSDAAKYSDNISGTINLLKLMVEFGVKKIIFSSSAAVYGMPNYSPVDENHPTVPINFYGHTKLECEKLIDWYAQVHKINYVCLRYFNVAGDGGLNYVDPNAKNVFPIIMEFLFGKRKQFIVYGDDYDTPDGTCVRDYIHVRDLVRAHILALDLDGSNIINLGTSQGYSVKEILDKTMEITGKNLEYSFGARRPGDPSALVASSKKARDLLGWVPEFTIGDMIKSTYDAYTKNL